MLNPIPGLVASLLILAPLAALAEEKPATAPRTLASLCECSGFGSERRAACELTRSELVLQAGSVDLALLSYRAKFEPDANVKLEKARDALRALAAERLADSDRQAAALAAQDTGSANEALSCELSFAYQLGTWDSAWDLRAAEVIADVSDAESAGAVANLAP